jgi:hypothetical protein
MAFVNDLLPFNRGFDGRGFGAIGGGFVRFFFGFSHSTQSLMHNIRESIDSNGHV